MQRLLKQKQPLPVKESFPAEDNFDLQRLPVKTQMLILQLLHREGSILLRTRAKEGGGISPQGEDLPRACPTSSSSSFPLPQCRGLSCQVFLFYSL